MVVHTPLRTARWPLPWSFSTFDYRELCALLWAQAATPSVELETATVTGREGTTVHTDRGELSAPLVVDALGWRRVLSNADADPAARRAASRAASRFIPRATARTMELWIDPRYVRAGYGWSFPARDELRVGVGSFWPSHHVKEPTVRLARDLGLPAEGYQGNWIPHQLRDAVEDGVFFAGDSAGHCLPLTAEGIRTALYFGLACGRELRAVVEGERTREQALSRYGAFSHAHERKYRWMFERPARNRPDHADLAPPPRSSAVLRAAACPAGPSTTIWRSRRRRSFAAETTAPRRSPARRWQRRAD